MRKVFDIWLTIWNKQGWISNEWYIIDLFAGRGSYVDERNKVSGSPLIFLEKISEKINKLRQEIMIKIFLIEENKKNFSALKSNIENYYKIFPQIKNKVEVK